MRCKRCQAAFTVVELITVILLLGILSVAAVSRMLGPDEFAPGIIASGTAEQFRLGRAIALSRDDLALSWDLSLVGDGWQLRSSTVADGVLRSEQVERGGTTIAVSNGGSPTFVDGSTPLTVTLDSEGQLASATLGASVLSVAAGIQLTIDGETTRVLCIYPTGFVHDAACE